MAVPALARLLLSVEERRDYARLVGMLRREWGVERVEDVVLRALREAGERS